MSAKERYGEDTWSRIQQQIQDEERRGEVKLKHEVNFYYADLASVRICTFSEISEIEDDEEKGSE